MQQLFHVRYSKLRLYSIGKYLKNPTLFDFMISYCIFHLIFDKCIIRKKGGFMFGFYRVAAASPKIKIGDPVFNAGEIIKIIELAESENCQLVLFPELSITGYSCGDLFNSSTLLEKAESALSHVVDFTEGKNIIVVVGLPLLNSGRLYNCAVVIGKGKIYGVVPKSYLPSYREFYEPRWFSSGLNSDGHISLKHCSASVPFGDRLIFEMMDDFIFGIEVCEDLWATIPPSSNHSLSGATVILNPSASNEVVSKAAYRRALLTSQSARCVCAYVYASSGVYESTTDLVYGGHLIIGENGLILMENERFNRDSEFIMMEIDTERLSYIRRTETSYDENSMPLDYRRIDLGGVRAISGISQRVFRKHPFVPCDEDEKSENCREIFNIQKHALATRLEHTGIKKVVLGISGGLDSTLALLVCAEAFKLLNIPLSNIIAVTMPGFGTTSRTLKNALSLIDLLGTRLRKIDITQVCMRHFEDIGHDPEVYDVTYENVQARERTQILMDIANKEGGLVVGTGDLSEIALGWSTYNGDHMSSYAVNCSVPKTLIRYLIHWVALSSEDELRRILEDVIATPVSPELLPKDSKGMIEQKTEEILGPYELHDFFLYHIIKYGAQPCKILFMAGEAFGEEYSREFILKCLRLFISRFFSNQFKRSCIPDGPKVGTISLSPRGDWRMPSDASSDAWLADIDGVD